MSRLLILAHVTALALATDGVVFDPGVLKKCCPPAQVIGSDFRCQNHTLPLNVSDYHPYLPDFAINLSSQSEFVLGSTELITLEILPDHLSMGRPQCNTFRSLELDNPLMYVVTLDGDLVSVGGLYEPNFHLGEFCLDYDPDLVPVAVVCDPCHTQICLRRCCHHLQEGSYDEQGLFYCKNSFRPQPARPPSAGNGSYQFVLIHGTIEVCEINRQNKDGHVLDLRGHEINLFSNGSITIDQDVTHLYQPKEYCLVSETSSSDYVRLCPQEDDHGHLFVVTRAYPICCTVSNLFLLLTFLVYCILPDLRQPLFGKIVMAFILSLFLAYLCISGIAFGHISFVSHSKNQEDYYLPCKIMGFLVLFFFLHTFAWMNVLSYDIYRKFTSIKHSYGKADSGRVSKRYIAYAGGVPTFVTTITALVEFFPPSYHGLRPGFGRRNCFFENPLASFVFFHLHLMIMQSTNIIFFVLTIRNLYRTWDMSRDQLDEGHWKTWDQVKIILKLYVVMGGTWLSEFLCFLFGWIYGIDVVWKYFVVNDIINLSQGILIFLALVCNASVGKKLKSLMFRDNQTSTGNQHELRVIRGAVRTVSSRLSSK